MADNNDPQASGGDSDQNKRPDESYDSEAGFNEQEQEEIRSRIEEVAGENRLPADDKTFSLADIPRGVVLPIVVVIAVLLLTGATVFGLSRAFSEEEQAIRNEAGSFASVEGRLVRELRREQRQKIGQKEAEIRRVRSQLEQLEQEQDELQESIEERIAEREREIREKLRNEIEDERARLIAEGLDDQDLEQRITQFEADRREYYEKQLEQYREKLRAEQAQLRSEIESLRSEYRQQIETLREERQQLMQEFERRKAELRQRLQEDTRAAQASAANPQDASEARERFATLREESEDRRALRQQIVGQFDRIRQAMAQGQAELALDRVNALQSFLDRERVRSVESIAARRQSDLFLLSQLEDQLRSRLQQRGASDEQSVAIVEELSTLNELEELSSQLAASSDPERRTELLEQMLTTMGELGEVQTSEATLEADQVLDSVAETRSGEPGSAEQAVPRASSVGVDAEAGAAPVSDSGVTAAVARAQLQQQVVEYRGSLEQARTRITELQQQYETSRNTAQELRDRVASLEEVQNRVEEAQGRYEEYLQAVSQARQEEETNATLVARQEFTEFLQGDAVSQIFEGLSSEVTSLLEATQTDASGAALADAADVVSDVMSQPNRQAQMNLLEFELQEAQNNEELRQILQALDDALSEGGEQ